MCSSSKLGNRNRCPRASKGSKKPGGTKRYNRKRNLNRIFYLMNSSLLLVAFGQWRMRMAKMKKLKQHLRIRCRDGFRRYLFGLVRELVVGVSSLNYRRFSLLIPCVACRKIIELKRIFPAWLADAKRTRNTKASVIERWLIISRYRLQAPFHSWFLFCQDVKFRERAQKSIVEVTA